MDNVRKEYTFFWFIENYSYCWHKNGKRIVSLNFTVEKLESTTWMLELYPRGEEDEDEGYISLFLSRSKQDDGPEIISLNYELSIIAADGSAVQCSDLDYAFIRGDGYGTADFMKTDEILSEKNNYLLPHDILTVRCKIWKGEGDVHNIGQSFARTRIRIEKNSFLHVVENFSKLQPNVKHTTKFRSHSKKGRLISSSVYFIEKKLMADIVLPDTNQILCECKLSLLNGSKDVTECVEIDNRNDAERKSIYIILFSLTRDKVLNRKSEFLPDDKLSLMCECTFSSGIEFQTIEETFDDIPLDLIKHKSSDAPVKYDFKAAEKLSTQPSLLEDIKSLYINQCLTDVELKTKTKSFPAHKNVLCARSPVFSAMMTNDMKEKNTDCIHVDDLEDEIVQKLLLFLYSDTVDDLQWNTATQLYYAADKYQIGKLKEVSSSFLVENLAITNAGELLLLADTHSDISLKKSVEDFILEHEEQVFGSKEWDLVVEKNPLLVIQTMKLKYKKKNELN